MRHHVFAAAVAATLTIVAGTARATVYFVDGACATSGTGTQLGCGSAGPFRTIAQGVAAMHPGDTLNVRGGVYREQVTLASVTGMPGGALACTAGAPCVIQGCRAPACPTNEVPVIAGWMPRNDWTARGGGVYSRTMEASPQASDQRDAWDPGTLYDAAGLPLGYEGDSRTAIRPGHWSYHPSSHQIYVHPGTAAPATLRVPHFTFGAYVKAPTTNLTLRYLRIEGVRHSGTEIGQPGAPTTGLVVDHVEVSGFLRFGMHGHTIPGATFSSNTIEYGCRGASWIDSGWGGCFGIRVFGAHGSLFRDNVIRHFGMLPNCTWCDAPWNDGNQTSVMATGNGLQVKQTADATVVRNTLSDLSTRALFMDVSRRISVTDNVVTRTRAGIAAANFTPQPSCCPSTASDCYCTTSDVTVQRNLLVDIGGSGVPGGCVLNVENGTRHVDAHFLADVRFNTIVAPRGEVLCLPSPMPADLTVSNNTITSGGGSTTTSSSTTTTSSTSLPGATTSSTSSSSSSSSLPTVTTTSSTTSTSTAGGAGCGNGDLEAPEECDDGNTEALDGCDGACLLEQTAVGHGTELATPIAPPGDPFGAAVDSPGSGALEIVETSATEPAPPSVLFLDTQIYVRAPSAPPANPLVLTFAIDDVELPSSGDWVDLEAFRNGGLVPPCTGAAGRATPNPCLDARTQRAGGGAVLTVLTTRGGDWNFGLGVLGTSTTTTSTTTTTSLPPAERCLGGSTLRLRDNPEKPNKRRLYVDSQDMPELILDDQAADLPALIELGGSLRVVAVGGDAFDVTYPLLPESWRLIDPKQPHRGVRYRNSDGPINSVRLLNGRALRIAGKGPGLTQGLTLEPELVRVELHVGQYRYHLEFGGEQRTFKAQRSLVRKRSLRPSECGAGDS